MVPEELQIFIAAASFTIFHTAVLVLPHIRLSQIHYLLNAVRKIF